MLNSAKKVALLSVMLFSTSSFAALTTASFGGVADGGRNFDEFSVTQSGVTVNVSGWSDTAKFSNISSADNKIEKAYDLDKYNGGWSMQNQDERSRNCGYSHSADNVKCRSDAGDTDYDFFLLEFSENVSLKSATYGWVYGYRNDSASQRAARNQVSVAALKNNNIDGQSWAGIKSSLVKNNGLASDYSQMQYSSGYYTNFAGSNVAGTESKYWIIGALNSIFGGDKSWEGNDGMKLASVSFHKQKPKPPVDAPEPSSLIVFALAFIGLAASRKKKLS